MKKNITLVDSLLQMKNEFIVKKNTIFSIPIKSSFVLKQTSREEGDCKLCKLYKLSFFELLESVKLEISLKRFLWSRSCKLRWLNKRTVG